jgi:hypothetical protein
VAAVSGVKGKAGGYRYNAADYRDEMQELVCHGLSTREFIERSRPSLSWFRKHVLPISTLARCHACGRYFNPSKVGMMVECQSPRCPVSLDKQRV